MPSLPQFRNSGPARVEAFPSRFDRGDINARDESTERTLTHRRARILSIGDDSILLYSRRLILETAGYSVESARGDVAAVEEPLSRRFDLILLCHSIPDEVVGHIAEASTRISPQTLLLQITPLDNAVANGAHPALVSADPAALLSAVASQLADHGKQSGNHFVAAG